MSERKKIAVIGSEEIGKQITSAMKVFHDPPEVIMVNEVPNIITIGEVSYQERPTPPVSRKALGIIAIAAAMGGYMPSIRHEQLPNVDIVSEYRLIQQKASKLSRRQRELVVAEFHRRYQIVIR